MDISSAVQASAASCEAVTVRVRPVGGRVRLIAAANSSTGSGPSAARIRTAILISPRSVGLTVRLGSMIGAATVNSSAHLRRAR